jgi:hypothetical protein
MADRTEIRLGNGQHTLYSDEEWFLIVPPGPAEPFLECRFQTDAPERTGFPTWAQPDNEFCVARDADTALCRLPLKPLPRPDSSNRSASMPDAIWRRAVEESAKL